MRKIGISVLMISSFISAVYFASSKPEQQDTHETIQSKEVKQIYILGCVDKPGKYPVNDTFTVSQLLRENNIKLIIDEDVSREPEAATYNSEKDGRKSTLISRKHWGTLTLQYTPEAILTVRDLN
jgi:hypothetical protein